MNAIIGLNSLLDDFYSSHTNVNTVRRWLTSHPFEEGHLDHAEAAWMEHETQNHLVRTRVMACYTKDVSYRRGVARGGLPVEFCEGH